MKTKVRLMARVMKVLSPLNLLDQVNVQALKTNCFYYNVDDEDDDDDEDDTIITAEQIVCPRDCICSRNMNGFMVATCSR